MSLNGTDGWAYSYMQSREGEEGGGGGGGGEAKSIAPPEWKKYPTLLLATVGTK